MWYLKHRGTVFVQDILFWNTLFALLFGSLYYLAKKTVYASDAPYLRSLLEIYFFMFCMDFVLFLYLSIYDYVLCNHLKRKYHVEFIVIERARHKYKLTKGLNWWKMSRETFVRLYRQHDIEYMRTTLR